MNPVDLSSADFFKALKKLRLAVNRKIRSGRSGERLSLKRGSSVEFMDYRQYNPGDDIRAIDWNLWGRLDKFYIKLFQGEESTRIFFLVDRSASMGFGTPSKWEFAMQFCAAMSWISLEDRDEVQLAFFTKSLEKELYKAGSRGEFQGLLKRLEAILPSGESSFEGLSKAFLGREKRPSVVFVISDFYEDPEKILHFARPLAWHKHDLYCIHLLSPEEINPVLGGLSLCEDRETGERIQITRSPAWVSEYKRLLDEHCIALEGGLRKLGCRYKKADTSSSLSDFLVELIRNSKGGI